MSGTAADTRVGFVGLGRMGAPMASRLVAAGYPVVGFDPSPDAATALRVGGGKVAETAAAAVTDADVVILMLPSSAVVESVLAEPQLLAALQPGTLLVDMGSSEPLSTRRLAATLADRGVSMIDAPVSGGVKGAVNGSLTIMVGGDPELVGRAEALLAQLGTARRAGDIGAGHGLKAINNLLSAVHLLATAEGVAIGEQFGIDPAVLVSMINSSSGRSGSTDNKFPNFVLPGTYDSGFALGLMLKDMLIATELGRQLGVRSSLGDDAVELWSQAAAALGPAADHTEVARWVHSGEPASTNPSTSTPATSTPATSTPATSTPAAGAGDAQVESAIKTVTDLEGGWTSEWQTVAELDPTLLTAYANLASVPDSKSHLSRKDRELVAIAVDAAATHLQPAGIRTHVRNALDHGATAAEIVEVVQLAATVGIHAMNIGVPLLVEVLSERGLRDGPAELSPYQQDLKTRFSDTRGYWHPFWNEILELDPEMFEAYTDFSSVPWEHGTLSPKIKELVYIAFDGAATHLYVKGWKLHIENALGHGATVGEIVEVLEIASLIGMKSATVTLPILASELERSGVDREGSAVG